MRGAMSDPRQSERGPSASGKLIVLEGIDGAGTTTQARRLVEALTAAGKPARLTREPSDGPIGVLIRQVLTGRVVARPGHGAPMPMDGASVALLFAADRLDHIHSEIQPLLERGTHVISDRYVLSSLAYQSLDNDLEWVMAINEKARTPDLTVFLDVPEDRAMERRKATRDLEERFEAMDLQRRVAESYRTLAAEGRSLGEIVTLDGTAGVDDVARAIWESVSPVV